MKVKVLDLSTNGRKILKRYHSQELKHNLITIHDQIILKLLPLSHNIT